jgi:ABC-2 type transport system permease protein
MPSHALNIAGRVIHQLIRDRRTMALIILVPVVMMGIIGASFPEESVLDYIAPAMIATLALFFSFLLTGISFLRERSQGTLERLMASPVTRLDVVVGYLFGFFLFALAQTSIIILFTIYVLGANFMGELLDIFIFQTIIIAGAVTLGIFTSTFARNEFQMVQFIPLIITPQIFLAGILWPVEQMPEYLQWLSRIMPLTYAVDGLRDIMLVGQNLLDVGFELAVLIGFTIVTSLLAASVLRRGAA